MTVATLASKPREKKNYYALSTSTLRRVAKAMGPLKESVVFLGGTVVPFFLSDAMSPYVRYAKDVDFIIDFDDKNDLFLFEDALWDCGFKKFQNGAVSRWMLERIVIDAIPADPEVLTFNNQWCAEAMRYAERIDIGEGLMVNAISAPYYLGTKLNAFERRGRGRFEVSKDIYDMLLIFSGRPSIEMEIKKKTSARFKRFLFEELGKIAADSADFANIASRGFRDDPILQRQLPEAIAGIKRVIAFTKQEGTSR